MNTLRTIGITATVAAALIVPMAAATSASAQGGHPGVRASGTCTAGGTWQLSAKPDDGRIEVEFEVDTNVAGQVWKVRVVDGSTVVVAGTKTTRAPSGSFSVERLTTDHPGRDTITAVAKRAGNICSATVTL